MWAPWDLIHPSAASMVSIFWKKFNDIFKFFLQHDKKVAMSCSSRNSRLFGPTNNFDTWIFVVGSLMLVLKAPKWCQNSFFLAKNALHHFETIVIQTSFPMDTSSLFAPSVHTWKMCALIPGQKRRIITSWSRQFVPNIVFGDSAASTSVGNTAINLTS